MPDDMWEEMSEDVSIDMSDKMSDVETTTTVLSQNCFL